MRQVKWGLFCGYDTTVACKVHGWSEIPDCYRFSIQAVREVIYDKFDMTKCLVVRNLPNPYVVAAGTRKKL